jgi:hypothetical protein
MSAMARAMLAEARLSTGSMALRRISSMELLAGLGMRFSSGEDWLAELCASPSGLVAD